MRCGVPLPRRTPLSVYAGLRRYTPLRPRRIVLDGRGGDVLDPEVHTAVWDRCGSLCDICGRALSPVMYDVHHRKLRAQGGTHDPATLIVVHRHCHRDAHDHPAWAYRRGYLVPSWADPSERPVLIHGESYALPGTEWTYSDPKETAS